MRVQVDVSVESGRLGVSRVMIVRAATAALRAGRVKSAILSVAFVSNRTIVRLNRTHLGHRGPTDVISFGYPPAAPGSPLVGDVYIGLDVARVSARARGIRVREELVRLAVHGTLHVMGYDHPDGESRVKSRMWKVQERVVREVLGASR
jgi:probable rRNA maturation factor